MSTTGWVVLGIIVVLVVWAISIYNSLVAMRQRTNQAFADIDVQLKQRHDLIPNLVETVKGYATHERGTLEAVVQARNAAMAAPGVEQKVAAENALRTFNSCRPNCRTSRTNLLRRAGSSTTRCRNTIRASSSFRRPSSPGCSASCRVHFLILAKAVPNSSRHRA
jgi:hypothetical protein